MVSYDGYSPVPNMSSFPTEFHQNGVVVCASQKVLMEVDDNNAHNVFDPQVILGKQLRPHPIHLVWWAII